MYYVLTSPVGPGKIAADFFLDDRFHRSWYTGATFKIAPPNPLELTWDRKNEKGIRKPFYGAGMVLMLKDLVAAFVEAGVKNLETYPVVIKSKTKKPDCHDYVAVNIIGVIKAVDRKKSVILDDSDGCMMCESLALDEKKAKGALLFRLEEARGTVIIHEKIVKQLQKKGGFGLTFVKPADHVT